MKITEDPCKEISQHINQTAQQFSNLIMCYTNSTHETPFKTSITSSTMYSTPLLAELGDKVSVQRPCDTRHHKRNTWHLAIWHQVWIKSGLGKGNLKILMQHETPKPLHSCFLHKKTSEI